MEIDWGNMQVFKIETKYRKCCSQLFYRMAVLKISENSQEFVVMHYFSKTTVPYSAVLLK